MASDKTYLVYHSTYTRHPGTYKSVVDRKIYYDDNFLENYDTTLLRGRGTNMFPVYGGVPNKANIKQYTHVADLPSVYAIELPSHVKEDKGTIHSFLLLPSDGELVSLSYDISAPSSMRLPHTNTTNIKALVTYEGVYFDIPLYEKDMTHQQLSNLI